MTDLEKEILRQIHELAEENKKLSERVTALENKKPVYVPPVRFGSGRPTA